MIQRIQTVYLLAVAGMFIALLFFPLAFIQTAEEIYTFRIEGLQTTTIPTELVYPAWSLMVIGAIIIVLSFIIIFMYKKRVLQMRMCVYNALLMIGFCALAGYYIWQFSKSADLPDFRINFRFWASFPFVALILNYLAIRNIGADETMVRSLERLR